MKTTSIHSSDAYIQPNVSTRAATRWGSERWLTEPCAKSDRHRIQLPNTVTIKVVEQDGSEIIFKCKETALLDKLMDAYLLRTHGAAKGVRFFFKGDVLNGNQTPKELGMEDGDVINVMVE